MSAKPMLVCMTLLTALGGFLWGRKYGYDQGKTDTMKVIERRLNEKSGVDRPV